LLDWATSSYRGLYLIKLLFLASILIAAGLLLLTLTRSASAWDLLHLKWENPPISVYLDASISDDEWRQVIKQSMSDWNEVGTQAQLIENPGPSASITIWASPSETCGLACADSDPPIETQAEGYFNSCWVQINTNYQFTTTGESTKYDLYTAVAHELGHCLGLDHNSDDPNESDPILRSAIMYSYISLGEHRHINSDDIAGLEARYPSPGGTPTPTPGPTPTPPVSNCTPSKGEVALYVDPNYDGQCIKKGIGRYANPSEIGLPNDSISSLRVGADVKARLCRNADFSDTCEWFDHDDSDLRDNSVGDNQVSSVEVESRYPCSADTDQVILFVDRNYDGQNVRKCVGDYPNPDSIGLPNDSISSLKVGAKVKAMLCRDNDFSNTCEWFDYDDNDLGNNSVGSDQVSSVKVTPRYQPPGVPHDPNPATGAVIAPTTILDVSFQGDGDQFRIHVWGNNYDRWRDWDSNRSMHLDGLILGQEYHWQAQARNSIGESPWSDEWIFTIANTAPAVEAGDDQVVNEGDTVSLAPATFRDPDEGDTHTATIDWGDGTVESGIVTEPDDSGVGTVSGSHVFVDNGVFAITLCVTDDGGAISCDILMVTVNNVAPTVTISGPTLVNEGDTQTYTVTITDPGVIDTHTVVWDCDEDGFDDGTGISINCTFPNGPKTVVVVAKATDKDGGSSIGELTITVVAPCTLDLEASYTDGTLTLGFTLGTSEPATWRLWLVLDQAPGIIPLVPGRSLPPIDPAITVSPSFPFPSMGTIGFLAILSEPDGIICWDFAIVDTGSPSASAAPSAEKLKGLFRKLGELLPKDE